MRRILWISPVGSNRAIQPLSEILESAKRPDTEVEVVSLDRGPHHVEYRYYEALVLTDVLHEVKSAESKGYDATLIGCFYDLGLEAGRELSESMPVIAPAEATTVVAASLADKFSVVVGRDKWIPQMRQVISHYGFQKRLASFRSIDTGVLGLQADQAETETRILDEASYAVSQDGAEAIILGCTTEYGFHASVQDELGVPVLDAVIVPFKFSEFMCDLAELGWSHSKHGGYESPPVEEILEWDLPSDYDNADVWY